MDDQRSKVEIVKENSRQLRGDIEQALQDDTSHFEESTIQVLKFHGVYQQDHRDVRKQLSREGKARHYMMMIRARIPGGVLNASQYLQFDRLADDYGDGSMRITTRQTFQLHGILKSNLKETIRSINDVLVTTLGGCGDQVRNTVSCAAPHRGPFYDEVRTDLLALVDRLSARTRAYHEIWLDGEKVALDDEASDPEEPLYGQVYLPRKFKIAIAYEGDNCVDVYANDIGIIAHRDGETVAGYTLVVGGGMGRTASDQETHPLLASPLCFVRRDEIVETCTAIVMVQRDHGNRVNRKFGRMKYLIETKGVDWFRDQVESVLGRPLTPPRELVWQSADDHLGRWETADGRAHLGLFVENGRIKDTDQRRLKSVLRELVTVYQPDIRLTTQQNLIFTNLTPDTAALMESALRAANVPLVDDISPVHLHSMACPAMPTCGLAIAESERALPAVIRDLDAVLQSLGLGDESITVRMTGCANGCARPYIAEIGLVGRVLGKYDLLLGASALGTRLNQRFREMVPAADIVSTLVPLLQAFRDERMANEGFGAYCHRVGFTYLEDILTATV